jgi:hypothetical protein
VHFLMFVTMAHHLKRTVVHVDTRAQAKKYHHGYVSITALS